MQWIRYAVVTVFLLVGGVLVGWWNVDVQGSDGLVAAQVVLFGLAVPFGLAWFSNYFLELSREGAYILRERQKALSMTPQTVLSENMKQMHPTAIDVLRLYGKMTWMILPGAKPEDGAEHVLYGTQCTWDFIAEFLRSSTYTACVAEWRFANDGAKHYAPHAMKEAWCTDREQYQQFVAYLYGLARITLAHGNQPAAWIHPWNPETVARSMGIRFDDDVEEVEVEAVEEAVA